MSLNEETEPSAKPSERSPPTATSKGPAVSMTLLVVLLLVVAGASIGATVAYYNFKSPAKSPTKTPPTALTLSSFAPSSVSIVNGTSVTYTVSATGGKGPYSYAYDGLPSGCTSANVSTLSCTPQLAGSYTTVASVTDPTGTSVTGVASLQVTPATGASVTDDAGRTVTVPSTPERIISLIPSATDILIQLGLRSRIVGIDCTPTFGGILGDYTPGQVANWSLSSIPCVTAYPSLDFTQVYALSPDLVIGGSENGLANLETITSQDDVPTLYISPNTLLGIAYDVQIVAQLTGTEAMGIALNQEMSNALNADQTLLQNATVVPRVLVTYDVDSNGYWTYGTGTFGNDLISLAGAVSVTANNSLEYPEVSSSYVLASDPQAILLGVGFGLNASYFAQNGPDWSSLPAVQSGDAFSLDVTLLTEPDPLMVLGLATLIHVLHPELSGGPPL